MSKVRFLNVMIDSLFMDEAIAVADELVKKRNNSFIVTPNVDHLVLLESSQELRDAYSKADLVLADGMPIVWLSKYYGGVIKEKISGSDFLPKLCELSAQRGYKVFFLGAAPGVAEKAAENMKACRSWAACRQILILKRILRKSKRFWNRSRLQNRIFWLLLLAARSRKCLSASIRTC